MDKQWKELTDLYLNLEWRQPVYTMVTQKIDFKPANICGHHHIGDLTCYHKLND